MSWLKRVLGFEAPLPVARAATADAGPLDLAAEKTVTIDPSLKFVLSDKADVTVPAAPLMIWSVGIVDLGQSNWLSRYYMDDNDTWMQVHTSGARDGQVESVILFQYLSCVTVNSDSELKRLAGEGSLIGLPAYEHNCKSYAREWGTDEGQTELVEINEHVCSPKEFYDVKHHSMLYARETGIPNRREFLLFSVEEDEEDVISISTSIGVSLYTTDLQVI
jgi:hypothetical protein